MTEERATYDVTGQTEIRQGCRLPFADPRYQPPTKEEIRTALKLAGFTGATAGDFLGVSGRTIRKWTGDERPIPYSAWRLLLIKIGLAESAAQDMAADGS